MNSPLNDKKRWEQIRAEDRYLPLRDILSEKYEQLKETDLPVFTFSLFINGIKTGDRHEYETVYRKRREFLTVYTLLSLIYPDEPIYLSKLEDVICSILEEYTWCLPAHLPADRLNSPCHIDLFAAETGLYVTEIKHLLYDRLSPVLVERITQEVDRRIIQSFRNNHYIFEDYKSNWASVCGGSVGAVLLYENLDVYMEVKPRIEKCMSNYLESIDDEGVSSEGSAYLQYGLTFYLIYNDLLKRETLNRINNVNIEKIRKVAKFIDGINLSRDIVFPYADGGGKQSMDVWMVNYLRNNVSSDMPAFYGTNIFSKRLSSTIRNYYMYEPITAGSSENKTIYFENFGALVSRKDIYAIGIKAGHNGEEHNHNDVGSFSLVADNKQLLCDLGAPLYTIHGFKAENYDKVIQRSSFGHNVPIINGKPQHYGKQFFGTIKVDGNEVVIDFPKAYDTKINKLTRTFSLLEKEIILKDEFDENVVWKDRFVSLIEPVISEGLVKIDCLNIIFDNSLLSVGFKRVVEKNHSNIDTSIYLIDFETKNNESKAEYRFTFDEGTKRG